MTDWLYSERAKDAFKSIPSEWRTSIIMAVVIFVALFMIAQTDTGRFIIIGLLGS